MDEAVAGEVDQGVTDGDNDGSCAAMGDKGFEDGGCSGRNGTDSGDVVEEEGEQAPQDGKLEISEDAEQGGEETGDEAHQGFDTEVALNIGGGAKEGAKVRASGGVHVTDAGAEARGFEQKKEHDDQGYHG